MAYSTFFIAMVHHAYTYSPPASNRGKALRWTPPVDFAPGGYSNLKLRCSANPQAHRRFLCRTSNALNNGVEQTVSAFAKRHHRRIRRGGMHRNHPGQPPPIHSGFRIP